MQSWLLLTTKSRNKMRVAVVGMGSIGRAWTISFLRAGFDVSVWNRNGGAIDEALILIEGVLSELEDKGLLNGQHPHILMNRIQRIEITGRRVEGGGICPGKRRRAFRRKTDDIPTNGCECGNVRDPGNISIGDRSVRFYREA